MLATYGVVLPQAERTNEAAGRYAAACRDLGAELGLPVLDLWTELQAEADWATRLLCDGLHLTEAGNRRVGELLVRAVQARWPELRPEAMPLDVPEWSALVEDTDVAAALAAHVAQRRAPECPAA